MPSLVSTRKGLAGNNYILANRYLLAVFETGDAYNIAHPSERGCVIIRVAQDRMLHSIVNMRYRGFACSSLGTHSLDREDEIWSVRGYG